VALAATEKDTAAHILLIHAKKLARIVLRAHHVFPHRPCSMLCYMLCYAMLCYASVILC
jgi:hypothetical protein